MCRWRSDKRHETYLKEGELITHTVEEVIRIHCRNNPKCKYSHWDVMEVDTDNQGASGNNTSGDNKKG